jgi:prepilin-type N-terminal cleavage/methylation domain-containing protein
MKSKSGFTLVELIIVIVIIGILTTIAAFNYLSTQRYARDKQRSSDAVLISESLESYYAKHGEYPSVAKVTNSDGNTVKQLLGLSSLDGLLAPFTPSGTTNSWKSGSADSSNTVTYSGNTDTSASCNTGTAVTDSCADFKIEYFNEQDNTTAIIYSRNKSTAVDVIAREGVVAPDAPVLAVALVGNNAVATASAVTCQAGATAQYSFQTSVNDGAWSAWTGWGTSNTTSATANQGGKYEFRAKARCQINTADSADSPVSNEVSYIRPISTPAAPTLSVQAAADMNSGTWSWPATTCPTGTTAQYKAAYYRDDATAWRPFGSMQAGTSISYTTNYEGYNYLAKAQVQCFSNFASSAWSADSNTPGFINPVTAPTNAYNFVWSTYNGSPLFDWSEPTCGLGTVLERRYWTYSSWTQYFSDGSSSAGKATTDIFNATRPPSSDTMAQWEYGAQTNAGELDMTIVNQTGFTPVSAAASGFTVSTGSPNTNSHDTESVRIAIQLRCINNTTNRNAAGSLILSPRLTR